MDDPGSPCVGELPVFGTICCPQNKVRLMILDTPEDPCMATYWEGRFTTADLRVIEGDVFNEYGLFGTFALERCDGEPEQVSGADPAW